VVDHATSYQHSAAMNQLKIDQAKDNGEPLTSVAPIVRSLMKLDAQSRERLRRKFDLSFTMAKEGIPFSKYSPLYQLESRHAVDMGTAYNNDVSCKSFTHFIATSQRSSFIAFLKERVTYFSFLMDGTTDVAKVEDEAVVLLYCQQDDHHREIKSCTRFLSVGTVSKTDTDGLLKCLREILSSTLGIEDVCDPSKVLACSPILVGGGTDGASVNIAQHSSIKANVCRSLPWIHWSWCFAHRLELASKNGFVSSLFKEIEEMLLRLYYLYEKSPKKVRELKCIAEDLKEVFDFKGNGCLPVRAQGSRWLNHKRKALQRIIDKFGAYLSHLSALCEDASLKSQDRARLKGYLLKWSHAKFLLGSAMFVEVLKGPAILSLCLQKSDCDIVDGLKQILKTVNLLRSLRQKDPSDWPTVKLVQDRVVREGSGVSYQGASLKNYTVAMLESCKKQALGDLDRLYKAIQERLEWSDTGVLGATIAFLDTQSWVKRPSIDSTDDEDASLQDVKNSIELLCSCFRDPLEATDVSVLSMQDEIEDAVVYARSYLGIENTDYRKVWYNLFVCPDAARWPNVLMLCKLLFSLPFSNARVEQIFSSLKYLKSTKRNSLQTSTLNDLLEIYIEGPTLAEFSADSAIELWLSECTRRPQQSDRKKYKSREQTAGSSSTTDELESDEESETRKLTLDEWDQWFCSSDDSDVSSDGD